jgi:hypothetical protein
MSDASHCPRCGRSNRCSQADSTQPVTDCWCFHTPLPPAALDQLPEAERKRSCLCANCLHELAERARRD